MSVNKVHGKTRKPVFSSNANNNSESWKATKPTVQLGTKKNILSVPPRSVLLGQHDIATEKPTYHSSSILEYAVKTL